MNNNQLWKTALSLIFLLFINLPIYANVYFSATIPSKQSVYEYTDNYFNVVVNNADPNQCTYEWTVVEGYARLDNDDEQTVTVKPRLSANPLKLKCVVTYNSMQSSPTTETDVLPLPNRHVRHSTPAIWVNYADPRPKGDDADKGVEPSYVPQVSVNNVSITPAVSHNIMPVRTPDNSFDMSVALNYSPPSYTLTHYPNVYGINYSPSPFGYGWSDSLTPIAERYINRGEEREHTFSFSGGSLPSASFYYKTNNVALPQPLTRASLQNNLISYWQSGTCVDFSDALSNVVPDIKYNPDDIRIAYWPKQIYDRKGNSLHFTYSNILTNKKSGYSSNSRLPQYTAIRTPLLIINNRNSVAIKYINGADGFVTAALHYVDGIPVRTSRFEYVSHNILSNWNVQLLNKVILPNNDSVTYSYITKSFLNNTHSLPYLSQIVSPSGTTDIN